VRAKVQARVVQLLKGRLAENGNRDSRVAFEGQLAKVEEELATVKRNLARASAFQFLQVVQDAATILDWFCPPQPISAGTDGQTQIFDRTGGDPFFRYWQYAANSRRFCSFSPGVKKLTSIALLASCTMSSRVSSRASATARKFSFI